MGIDHTIGNPLFAIETNLNPLRKQIQILRTLLPSSLYSAGDEALAIVDEIEKCVNNAKNALKDATKEESHAPEEAKKDAVKFLLENGYGNWLKEKNLLPKGLVDGEINFEEI